MPSPVDMARITLFLLYLSFTSFQSYGFRIRRSGLAGFNDPYALSNAIAEIDRRRRRTDYGPLVLDDDSSYFNPNSLTDLDESDEFLIDPRFLDETDNIPEYFPNYRYKQPFPSSRNILEYPVPDAPFERPVYTPQKRMSVNSHAFKRMGQSSMNDLQRIFASADVPQKKLAPVKRREPVISHDAIEAQKSPAKQTKDLVEKVRELLATAKKITMAQAGEEEQNGEPAVVKDVVVEELSPDGSTKAKEEIVEVTETEADNNGGSDSPDVEDNAAEVDGNENEQKATNEEELVEDTDDDVQALSKSKRASSKLESDGYVKDLEDEVRNLRSEYLRLQFLHMLEEKENDHLANALKYATLNEIEDDDRFVLKEYDDINKATDIEELIQQISNADDEETSEVAGELLAPGVFEEDDVKRSSDLVPDEDGYLDAPVQESISYGAPIDNTEEDNSDNFPDMQGSEFPIDIPYPDDIDEDVDEEEGEGEDEEENEQEAIEEVAEAVNQELEEESEQQKQTQVLQELLQGLNKDEIESLIQELKDVNEERQEEQTLSGVCLPVLELSQNCAFADTLGIPVDEEARSLCSRHQMCYTCGATHGMSRTGCNDGYKGAVIDACEDDDNCIRQSAVFLRLMEKYHVYESRSSDDCRATCVKDFILGGE